MSTEPKWQPHRKLAFGAAYGSSIFSYHDFTTLPAIVRILMGTNNMSATMPSNIPFALPLKRSQRALNAPRGGLSGTLYLLGMSLTVSSNAISSDEALAAYYMQLYAQGTAFGQLQKESKKIHDPGILQSYDYFSHYITSLRSLGLNVTSASGQKVEAKSFSGSIKLSDILINVLSKYVSASQLADLTKLFDFLASTGYTQIVTLPELRV